MPGVGGVETTVAPVRAAHAASGMPPVEVFEWSQNRAVPVTKGLESNPSANMARENGTKIDQWLRTRFGRDGWDNNGSPVRVVVGVTDVAGAPLNEAWWNDATGRVYVGDGDGERFSPLAGSGDIIAHELVHGMVSAESKLRYEGQQGALNESFADVIAASFDDSDWLIGEDSYTPAIAGDGVRDLANPDVVHMDQVKGRDIEIHALSGIPSLAAVKVAESVGKPAMTDIWYTALVDHLDQRSGFSGAARATLEAATQLHGLGSREVQAVMDAWKAVGVDSRWKQRSAQRDAYAAAMALTQADQT